MREIPQVRISVSPPRRLPKAINILMSMLSIPEAKTLRNIKMSKNINTNNNTTHTLEEQIYKKFFNDTEFKVLCYLLHNESASNADLQLAGIKHPSSVVHSLKAKGVPICTLYRETEVRLNSKPSITYGHWRYHLVEDKAPKKKPLFS